MSVCSGEKATLIKEAEVGLQALRSQGKNRLQVFEEGDALLSEHKEVIQRIDMIEKGLKEERFFPYYQPIINNKTEKIEKYEYLARLTLND